MSLLAIECMGLITILDRGSWMQYGRLFAKVLSNGDAAARDKVVTLKAAVDGLIIHGVCDEATQGLFELIA